MLLVFGNWFDILPSMINAVHICCLYSPFTYNFNNSFSQNMRCLYKVFKLNALKNIGFLCPVLLNRLSQQMNCCWTSKSQHLIFSTKSREEKKMLNMGQQMKMCKSLGCLYIKRSFLLHSNFEVWKSVWFINIYR